MIRKIALEEHFLVEGFANMARTEGSGSAAAFRRQAAERLPEIDEVRLDAMNKAGIDLAVLSLFQPGVQGERDIATAIRKAKVVNDTLAERIAKHPTRFAVSSGPRALRKSLFAILENRKDEISRRTAKLIGGLYEDWCGLDERIETVTGEIEELGKAEAKCRRLRSVPGIGRLISTAVVAAIGSGEAFDRGRDFAAWLGLVPRQHSTGGRSILGRISKRDSEYLRTLLIHAAKVLLMRPHNRTRYSFGPWLNSASQRLHRNKLAVALANKLARIARSVLRHDKAFDTHLEAVAI